MSIIPLLSRIDELLAANKLSDRKACLKAHEINSAVGVDFLRDMRRRGHVPRSDKLAALAQVLQTPPEDLLCLIGESNRQQKEIALSSVLSVEVRGDVQAGKWREAQEWLPSERYTITIPNDGMFPTMPRYALLVKGLSMNKIFQEGTFVIVINFSDLGRHPQNGEYVVAMRRSRVSNEFEATVKAVQIKENGQIILWPRSTEPEFQEPIILPSPDTTVCYSETEWPDVTILGLVVGSYSSMPKAFF